MATTKKKKSFLAEHKNKIIAGAVIGILIFIAYKIKTKNDQANALVKTDEPVVRTSGNNIIKTGEIKTDDVPFNGEKILSYGLTSKEVLMAQRYINGLLKLIDRAYGTGSGAMGGTSSFNIELLATDGVNGPKTTTAFEQVVGKKTPTFNEVKNKVESEKQKIYAVRPDLKGSTDTAAQTKTAVKLTANVIAPWLAPITYFW